MNLWLSAIIIVTSVAVAIAAILLVRRHAPDGGFFNDSDRAAGVFGVLATAFSVLLAFVIFLGFTAFDAAKSGAEQEALIVAQQFETAEFFPQASTLQLEGQLACYARAVVSDEWPLLASSQRSAVVDSLGHCPLSHAQGSAAGDSVRGGRLSEVARPDIGPRVRAA